MLAEWIDHAVLPVADVAAAAAPFERLGLTLSPLRRHEGGTENRVFFAGDASSQFYVELLGVYDEAAAKAAGREGYIRAAAEEPKVNRLVLGTRDLAGAKRRLAEAGVEAEPYEVHDANGKICEVLPLGADRDLIGGRLALIQYEGDVEARWQRRAEAGLLQHPFGLKRLDHLAILAPELEVTQAFWTDVLGIPVSGEVRGRGIIIRQMNVGDAIVELLGPDSNESPLRQREPGISSMCAFEVENLDAAVAKAQAAGFTLGAPTPGILPGTRVATIPGAELSGLALQLLEYV